MNKEEIQTRLEEEKLAVESHQKRIEELEKELNKQERKAWDFGIEDKYLRIRGTRYWSFSHAPTEKNQYVLDRDIKYLGNLQDIINEGPIVIGISVEDAEYIIDNWTPFSNHSRRIVEQARAALERYNG